MASTNNGSNKGMVPEARAAMDRFKMEAAAEVGVDLKEGYNGDLTSRQAGSVGGQMVKKMCTVRTMSFRRADRTAVGHEVEVRYIAGLSV
ncbi:MAG: alpha/beta-type small acid-soluble spore protein [Clostridiales bacterium]|nr:alpha/beta-type small acid-soluble spore protein [Clostridiales bacterium]